MTPVSDIPADLVLRSRRRATLALAAAILPAVILAALLIHHYGIRALVPALLGVAALCLWAGPRLLRIRLTSPDHAAQCLDDRFAQLQDSTALVLDQSRPLRPLEALQREVVARALAPLADSEALDQALPQTPQRMLMAAWLLSAGSALLLFYALAPAAERAKASAVAADSATLIEGSRVWVTPPAYLQMAPRTVDSLNLETVEGASLSWSLQLSAAAERVELRFHNGETLVFAAGSQRSWTSEEWPARSTVYTVEVDGRALPGAVGEIQAQPDRAPILRVSAPQEALRLLSDSDVAPMFELAFEADDDNQVSDARARVTLARGSGEQVQFREQIVALTPRISDDGTSLSARHEIDLVALGMQRGDELYVFAEVTDNKPIEPNVGRSGTYLVRWPDEDAATSDPVVTMAMDVLPDYFRSQRQIIIDTEALIAQRSKIESAEFEQRAQTLAIDQKLLRLRYGQYLGEESDSGIGADVARTISSEILADPPHEDNHDDEDLEEDHTGHDHEDNAELAAHDHAGHSDNPNPLASMQFGDRQAAMDLYTHFHDTAEQATLFEPQTRQLLQQALSKMWDAELQLRLFKPDDALPHEYAALDFIKRVQQSSRIYLRRAGFRPTPIDETRRLTGELIDILDTDIDGDAGTGELGKLRKLFAHLSSGEATDDTLRSMIDDTLPGVQARSQDNSDWLGLLAALQRLQGDPTCADCRASLAASIWRRLSPARAAPTPLPMRRHPLARAYEEQLSGGSAP